MLERAPFRNCPSCKAIDEFGILSAGGRTLKRRCRSCRYTQSETLPGLDKRVLYLDQFAFSEIFKVKTGTLRHSSGRKVFWETVQKKLENAVLLQQLVCPTSDVHSRETIVFDRSLELRQACELIGGGARFKSTEEIEMSQFFEFARSFKSGLGVPTLDLTVERCLKRDRNKWLSDLHITTNMDYASFADEIRRSREQSASELSALAKRWKTEKPNFRQQLAVELEGYGKTLTSTFVDLNSRRINALDTGDIEQLVASAGHRVNILIRMLMREFEVDQGTVPPVARKQFSEFMSWEGLEHIPSHRISAYLFAALARRYANGQTRPPSRGTLNDFTAIATYGPYVDAMFLDRECATLLSEEPLKSELSLSCQIFSVSSGEEFIEYLDQLILQTPPDVKNKAQEIYGVQVD